MNKHTYLLKKAQAFARKHAHGAAALLSGIVMGVFVVTFAGEGFTSMQGSVQRKSVEFPPLLEENRSSSAASDILSSTSSSQASSKHSAADALHRAPDEVPSIERSIQSSSISSASSTSSISSVSSASSFPPFIKSSWPIAKVPNWGNMHSAAVWDRSFSEFTDADFVSIPAYDLFVLTTPMESLTLPWREENILKITAKLFYSTRYMGTYDVDKGEFTGDHDGVDLKFALGTPIGAIGGGRVVDVSIDERLGLHVIIEHRLANGETYFSIYGHFSTTAVTIGDVVVPGQYIGNVGMTGKTTAPHLHLQMAKGAAGQDFASLTKANSVHPVTFLAQWRGGE